MIEFYTGVPGSGKTYRAVEYIYSIFIDSKNKDFGKFKKFYTNINEFHFDAFPSDKAFLLEWDELYLGIKQLHDAYLKDKANDTQLKELADSLGLLDAFFVIDECHNYFERKDSTLTWWLSYHRHLHQDIILITQNLALVESKYKSFSEFFYKAIPSSLRLFSSSLKYEQYIGSRMFKTQRSKKFTLKFNPDVYALYTSGANAQGDKVVYKYIAMVVIALVVFVVAMYLIVNYLFGGKDAKHSKPSPDHNVKKSILKEGQKSDYLLNVYCDLSDCNLNGTIISVDDMRRLISLYNLKPLLVTRLPQGYYCYRYKSDSRIKELTDD